MKTTKRFDNTVMKLYKAFHNGYLKFEFSCACAVGNICNNSMTWRGAINYYGALNLDGYKGKTKKCIDQTGYSVYELATIEQIFMFEAFGLEEEKEKQYQGLCKVIEYLCELDGLENVMDYTSLFEYKEGVKELVI